MSHFPPPFVLQLLGDALMSTKTLDIPIHKGREQTVKVEGGGGGVTQIFVTIGATTHSHLGGSGKF